jgi:leader peptidase (prepilin peptidase)/N-methyltransferase
MIERLLVCAAAALAGATLGWLSAWAAEWLQTQDRLPSHSRGPLLRDPAVQGACALVWAAAAWLFEPDWLRWVGVGVLAVPLVQVGITDLRHRYVYTLVAIVGLALGLAFAWRLQDAAWWTSLLGAAGGGLAFLLLYLVGRLLYRGGEPLARGDITIAAMVGAVAASCTARALVLGVLLSGLFAVGVLIRRRSGRSYLPYGPGLCLGGLITLFWC